jgi:hypothetical protein
MNYNIIIDELDNEKIIIPKKNYYCSNCNKKGHTFKTCNEPIISNGIIAIYIKNFNQELIPLLEKYIIKNLKIFNNNYDKNTNSFHYNTNNHFWLDTDLKIKLTEINDNIQFLMVQRKNSLGYLEFIRGRYNLDNLPSFIHLIEQMTSEEISDIKEKDFDDLWNDLWDSNNIRNKNHHKEYILSKQKFYQLKLNHSKILDTIKPLYSFNEWGFPKGRRELYESDLVCGIREFEEETTLTENNYIILEQCKSIRENLTGTNGINYAHNYFLSILNDKSDIIDKTNREIGQTKVLNLDECLERIRPYHENKIRIIKNIYIIINNFLREHSKNKHSRKKILFI